MEKRIMNEVEDHRNPYSAEHSTIYITNPSPIILLFGPASSGKTMALIRLSLYLYNMGYSVVLDRTFRPSYDQHYYETCQTFQQRCHNQLAAPSTTVDDMLLLTVLDSKGRRVCQLFDAPGSFYFDKNVPEFQRPACVNHLMSLPNKRVCIFFVEPGWEDFETRNQYVKCIKDFSHFISRKDKTIFLINKIDKQPCFIMGNDAPKLAPIVRCVKNEYPDILSPFENKTPFTRWFRPYNCELVPFISGFFDSDGSGRTHYAPGSDIYPKLLWKAICDSL